MVILRSCSSGRINYTTESSGNQAAGLYSFLHLICKIFWLAKRAPAVKITLKETDAGT
jgi:hypothetical protein